MTPKEKYPLPKIFALIEAAIADVPKAAMFELADKGYGSLFEQMVSCIISIRTLDEVTIPVSLRLFKEARIPKAILALQDEKLIELLHGSSFPGQKADTIKRIAALAVQHGGELPANKELLLALKGVGIKCTNLALGVAAELPAISVDSHVHRVVNRWGLIQTKTAEKTTVALEATIPQKQWIDVNRLLMPFGKHICTWRAPKCSICPVLEWCEQVGVTSHR